MRMLIKLIRIGHRFRPAVSRAGFDAFLSVAILASAVGVVEFVGPRFSTELWDGLFALVLVLGTLAAILWLRLRQPGWLALAVMKLRAYPGKLLAAIKISVGIDFRPDSDVKLPKFTLARTLNLWLLGIVALLGLTVARLGHLPALARDILPYSVYLTSMGMFWLCLLTLDGVGLLFLYLGVRRFLRAKTKVDRSWRAGLALAIPVIGMGLVITADLALGPLAILATLVGCLFAPMAIAAAGSPAGYAYTIRRSGQEQLSTLSVVSLFMTLPQLIVLVGLSIYVMAQGYRFTESVGYHLVITPILGTVFTAILTLFVLHLTLTTLYAFFVRRSREDPSIARLTRIWLAPDVEAPSSEEKAHAEQASLEFVSSRRCPSPLQVDMILFGESRPEEAPSELPAYPRGDKPWSDDRWLATLKGRDDRRRRKHFLRGLRSLHEEATTNSYNQGEGFFFAPHCWLLEGLTRDEHDDNALDEWDWEAEPAEILGAPYHRVFGPRVRSFAHTVFQTCQIDLVFIQDGVCTDSVVEVLERLIEHARTGRPIQENDLQGIVRVSPHIQEIGLEEPYRRLSGYREPQYEEFSRARVLLLFRNPGSDDDDPEEPDPDTSTEDSDAWLRDALWKFSPQTC